MKWEIECILNFRKCCLRRLRSVWKDYIGLILWKNAIVVVYFATLSDLKHIASNGRRISELERIWKEEAMC
jgi:hypothetical protein